MVRALCVCMGVCGHSWLFLSNFQMGKVENAQEHRQFFMHRLNVSLNLVVDTTPVPEHSVSHQTTFKSTSEIRALHIRFKRSYRGGSTSLLILINIRPVISALLMKVGLLDKGCPTAVHPGAGAARKRRTRVSVAAKRASPNRRAPAPDAAGGLSVRRAHCRAVL